MTASESQLVSGGFLNMAPSAGRSTVFPPCLTSHDPLVNYRAVSSFEASKNSA